MDHVPFVCLSASKTPTQTHNLQRIADQQSCCPKARARYPSNQSSDRANTCSSKFEDQHAASGIEIFKTSEVLCCNAFLPCFILDEHYTGYQCPIIKSRRDGEISIWLHALRKSRSSLAQVYEIAVRGSRWLRVNVVSEDVSASAVTTTVGNSVFSHADHMQQTVCETIRLRGTGSGQQAIRNLGNRTHHGKP